MLAHDESFGAEDSHKGNKENPMNGLRMFVVAAGALAMSGTLAALPARAEVQDGAVALGAAAQNGVAVEQVDFGRCWRFGWRGPGWYPCGYFDRDDFREHREHEFREWREHREHEFREHHDHDRDFRRY
jgi:hypothetical protein